MGKVTCQDGEFIVSWITGPSHNMLALRFDQTEKVSVVEDVNMGMYCCGKVEGDKVEEAVFDVLKERFPEAIEDVSQIRFYADDTPRYDVYRHLTNRILKFKNGM